MAAAAGVDQVVHMAAIPSVPRSVQEPCRVHRVKRGRDTSWPGDSGAALLQRLRPPSVVGVPVCRRDIPIRGGGAGEAGGQVHGDGEQSRDFTYVTDAVTGVIAACAAPTAARAVHQDRPGRPAVNQRAAVPTAGWARRGTRTPRSGPSNHPLGPARLPVSGGGNRPRSADPPRRRRPPAVDPAPAPATDADRWSGLRRH